MIARDQPTASRRTKDSLPGKFPVLTVNISTGTFADQVKAIISLARARASAYVCCVNAHMTVEAESAEFARVVNGADLATPDGMPVLLALRRFHGVRQERVAGNDLMPALLARAAQEGIGVFLYGGAPETLRLIQQRAAAEHPGIRFAGAHSPPFGPLESMDLTAEAARIRSSGAALVLVSLGCPKQERFMAALKGKVDAVMVGLGGAFLLYAGIDTRAPQWMRNLSLEWLYRLALEPRRLWRRYLFTNTRFLLLVLKTVLARGRASANAPSSP